MPASIISSNSTTPKKQKIRVVVRNTTEENWLKVNPKIDNGEIVFTSDKNTLKVGDGQTKYSDLIPISGGESGTTDYEELSNKPSINNVTLSGDKTASDLGLATAAQGSAADTALQPEDNISELTNDSGFITGINSTDVTSALGYTPVDPSGLSTVATSGNYEDLSNKPSIPAAQVNSDWNANSGVAEILNKPTLGTAAAANANDFATAIQGTKADNAESDIGNLSNLLTTSKSDLVSAINEVYGDATSSVQSVTEGTTDGTINVDGVDVSVHGLGSAAYTNSTDYDSAGSATAAEMAAKNYADGLGVNYATAIQGSLADTALQPGDDVSELNNDAGYITGINSSDVTSALGYIPVDSSSLATVATTGSYNDLSDKPYIPAGVVVDQVYDANSQNAQAGIAVAQAVSTKQDTISDLSTIRSGAAAGATAVQPGDLNSYVTLGTGQTITAAKTFTGHIKLEGVNSVISAGNNILQEKALLQRSGGVIVIGNTTDPVKIQGSGTRPAYGDNDSVALLSDVPAAQVNSDWNSSSGVSEILNKPDLSVYALDSDVTTIESYIPSTTSSSNQLADKAFVNSSISNMAANYITSDAQGDNFATHAALINGPYYYKGASYTPTNNDYALVESDEDHSNATTRYMYDGVQWNFQYVVNNSPLSQAQLDAINSGITAAKVTGYDQLVSNVQADWNAQSGLAQILNKPSLATVATSGDYGDLLNKPTLGTAAAANATDFDAAGSAATVDAKIGTLSSLTTTDKTDVVSAINEVNGLSTTALQSSDITTGSTNGTIAVSGTDVSVYGLGSAAYTSSTDYATSAQGGKADTAIQPGDLATVATTGSYNDLSDKPTIPSTANFVTTNTAQTISAKKTTTSTIKLEGSAARIEVGTTSSENLSAFERNINTNAIEVGASTQSLNLRGSSNLTYNNNRVAMYSDVTSVQNQLSSKQNTITGAATTITSSNLSSNYALISNAYGKVGTSTVTSTQLGYLSSATSNIQDQLNNKQATISDLSTIRSGAAAGATAVQPADLATVATTGLYSDLSGTPTIPTVNDATITITQGGVTKGSFTLNQASGDTIALDAGGGSSLPSQTGHNGEFLTTDGTDPSWGVATAVTFREWGGNE